jgi:hypothetical protein
MKDPARRAPARTVIQQPVHRGLPRERQTISGMTQYVRYLPAAFTTSCLSRSRAAGSSHDVRPWVRGLWAAAGPSLLLLQRLETSVWCSAAAVAHGTSGLTGAAHVG